MPALALTVSLAHKISLRMEIARIARTASDMDIVELEVRAAAVAAEDVVILCLALSSAGDVGQGDAGDGDAVCGRACGAAVEVVLLDVDAVGGDILEEDVAVGDAVMMGQLWRSCLLGATWSGGAQRGLHLEWGVGKVCASMTHKHVDVTYLAM